MLRWRRPALSGLVTSLFPLAFFVAWPLKLRPMYQKMFDDFGSQMPPFTRLVMHPAYGVAALLLMLSGLGLGFMRPNERFIIFPLTAGGGFTLMGATAVALYFPVLVLAQAIH
jgi:hypothetical protein